MAQNKVIPAVEQSALLIAKSTITANSDPNIPNYQFRRKLIGVTIAQLGQAGSLLQLYDNADGTNPAKLIYQVDGTVAHPLIELHVPFAQLYAKCTGNASYNIIVN